mgnify:CR=1 FL=1|tara:strand:- start:4868 stop:6535 length:1668 start_codon:yes stop_codon:yes gene_type:complete
MCGIFAVIHENVSNKNFLKSIINGFNKGVNRGPENSTFEPITSEFAIGFHRLAINGYQKESSEQPIKLQNCVLICNGEIYNWKEIHNHLNIKSSTGSDCECIIHAYKSYGMKYTLNLLDGVFSFLLYDEETQKVFIARDPYGVRPLFMGTSEDNGFFCIASELKMISDFKNLDIHNYQIKQFKPGTYLDFRIDSKVIESVEYYNKNQMVENALFTDEETALHSIRTNLIRAVSKRVENTDRDIACLLSGGLDSSLIAGIVCQLIDTSKIHTWSIGMKGSEDLKYAKKVASFLKTNHHSIELEPKEFIDAIENVIQAVESYDTTTIRASVGNWLISKYIKEQSNAKVIFNGDGSDEVTGGYMYFHCAPDKFEFDKECRRLLEDIHFFDVLRSDRSIASHGLEARTPFLDKHFVQSYLSIPVHLRYHPKNGNIEKYLLRKAFDKQNIIPPEVLWRTKEAFSDGVSTEKEAWFETIQRYALEHYKESCYESGIYNFKEITPAEAEKYLYKSIFNKYYSGNDDIIPYMWMPKFVEATDASARTLDVYPNKRCKEKAIAT